MVQYRHIVILIGLSCLFFMIGNGLVPLTNPDEVFYAQTAREMADHHTWMVPYLFGHPQFEKPILTFWLLRLAFLMFGVSSFSARFFPAIFAALGVIFTYILAAEGFKDSRKAFCCAGVLMSAVFYVGMARSVFTDMVFSVFILMSLTSFFFGYVALGKGKHWGIVFFFVFSALAALTKGLLGFAFPFLTVAVFLAVNKDLAFIARRDMVWGCIIGCLIALPWYAFVIAKFGQSFTHEFFYNDHIRRLLEAEHRSNDRWYFYPGSTLLSIFPWIFFTAAAFFSFVGKLIREKRDPFHLFLASWVVAVFAICQVAHSKLISYVFPYLPAVAIITGSYVHDFLIRKNSGGRLVIPVLTAGLMAALPVGIYMAAVKVLSVPFSVNAAVIASIMAVIALLLAIFFIFKQWRLAFVLLVALQVPFIFMGAYHFRLDLGDTLSSRAACEYLLKTAPDMQGPILCSKVNVRGVRYHTQKEVAVIKLRGSDFFSPHPIPFIDTPQKLMDMLSPRDKTFCIITPSTMEQLLLNLGTDFAATVLCKFPKEWVVEIRNNRIG